MRKTLLLLSLVLVACLTKAQTVTWASDIAPILYANCTKCHNPNGAGHFSLLTYAEAYSYGFLMETQTAAGTMPPWPPNENYKHFVHERVMAQSDIDKIAQWVGGGRQQGDVTQAPAQPVYSTGSTLGAVDLTVRIPTYTVTSNSDVYRNFPITTTVPAGSYITAMEVIPGNHHAVHHVLVFQDSTNVPAQLDANQSGPGYNNLSTGSAASKLVGGFTPGSSPYYTPVGTGFRLAANTNIVVQVHYPAGSQGQVDSTRINFKLTTTPQRDITMWPLVNHLQNMTNGPINIPANSTRTYYEQYNVNQNYTFIAASPHMHLVANSIKTWANKTSSPYDTIRFVDIPNWDFHWQDNYIFPNAVKVPSGYRIQAVATYDNTTNNPNNPNNPPQTVTAGEATTDEMMMVFFGYMPYVNGDENMIIDRRIIPQGATTICNGQSVVLKTIEGTGYTYQWYRNGVSIGAATASSFSVNQAGNYHVLISLGPNNALSDTIPVTVVSPPVASITQPSATFCPGGSTVLTAVTGSGYNYQWLKDGVPLNGALSSTYTANSAGSYMVQVYKTCYSQSVAVNVTQAAFPSATITASGPTTFCQGGNVTLSAPAGLTYNWSTGANTQSIAVTQSGNYFVTVTDGNGCQAGSPLTAITVNSLPPASVTPASSANICQGQNVLLSAPAGYSYNWSNGATTQSVTVTQAGQYTVSVTNGNNCQAVSLPTTVTVNPLPSASITAGGPTGFCAGNSVTLTANSASSYHWSNNSSSQSIAASQQGNYAVTITDANGCSNTATTSITVYSLPDATVNSNKPTTICPGDSVILSGPTGLSYIWNTGAQLQSITVSVAGNYTLTVTDAHNCTAASTPVTVTLSTNAIAGITTNGPTTFCAGGAVQLTASAGTSYLWSTNETTASITVSAAGNYTVTVTEAGSCTAVSNPLTIVVNQPPATPAISNNGVTTFCEGETVQLSAPAGYTYNWSSGESTQLISVAQTGNFTVTITDINLCSAISNTVVVVVNALPVVTLTDFNAVCSNAPPVNIETGSPAGGTYSGVGVTGNTFNPAIAGVGVDTITYSYTDNNGCSNSAISTIAVTNCTSIATLEWLHFSLQPNPSDGNFELVLTGPMPANTIVSIFDMAGKLVYNNAIEKNTTAVNLNNVAAGCYLLQLSAGKEVTRRKLLVQ